MKRLYIYTALIFLMAGCVSDEPDAPVVATDRYAMNFQALTSGLTRDGFVGIYDKNTYPVNTNLYLTAFLVDNANERQYYFRDKILDYDSDTHLWSASDWYWPLQGQMSFLSYWCPGFSKAPRFDTIEDVNGDEMARMVFDATDLDGKTDLIYLSQTNSMEEVLNLSQQNEPTKLLYQHGLTWITVSLKVQVLQNNSDQIDETKTQTLINKLKINKVIIEDCARQGIATVIPGQNIVWQTYKEDTGGTVSYIRDQVFFNKNNETASPQMGKNEWVSMTEEEYKAYDFSDYQPIKFSNAFRNMALGVYDANTVGNTEYGTTHKISYGLLIIPQNKTAITLDYTVTDANNIDRPKVERYELRDNTEPWKPGYHYHYDIIFSNYDDCGITYEVVPSWEGIFIDGNGNRCYDSSLTGKLQISGADSWLQCGFVLEPTHDGGSATSDDMDYHEGPRVF